MTNTTSIIGYGTPSLIVDSKQKEEALNIIIDHYAPGSSYKFPEEKVRTVAIIRIEITQMTGKKSL
ncbi:MAG: pyridoxamine 5'-phosphate oxidase family protein [Euryarchaeota archaeon]|nr:pyridoxamine 5'-phosphate oxidase family protein [Euryarchaeota archaeon]